MLRIRPTAILVGIAGLLAAAPVASPASAGSTLYSLITPPSALEVGCFGPCECAIQLFPTYGSFQLTLASVDPLFTNYDITDYIASFNNGPGAVAIVGSGHYRIGGEVAVEQEMTLDLSVWGKPVEHFDSGLVPVYVPFPQIDVALAVHGFACEDSVVNVHASPVGVAGVSASAVTVVALTAVKPNPFRDGAAITLTLPRAGAIDLAVLDLAGRRVRVLAHGQVVEAGTRSFSWDGRRDDGRVAPAGIYWVILSCADGHDQRRVVKLD
jgi:hypothetical protein